LKKCVEGLKKIVGADLKHKSTAAQGWFAGLNKVDS
jgi:hypothetical protein